MDGVCLKWKVLSHKTPIKTHWRCLGSGYLIPCLSWTSLKLMLPNPFGHFAHMVEECWVVAACSQFLSQPTFSVPRCWRSKQKGLSSCSPRSVHWVALLYHLPALFFLLLVQAGVLVVLSPGSHFSQRKPLHSPRLLRMCLLLPIPAPSTEEPTFSLLKI